MIQTDDYYEIGRSRIVINAFRVVITGKIYEARSGRTAKAAGTKNRT